MKIGEMEEKCWKETNLEFIDTLKELRLLKRELKCYTCQNMMNFVRYKRNIDGYAWRCLHVHCMSYKKYFSVRESSFFSGFNISMQAIMLILLRYTARTPRYVIKRSSLLGDTTIKNILRKLNNLIPNTDFKDNKLGGIGKIVQVDETMLNFKCKSHRGRSSNNRTDALCIVEVNNSISKVFAQIIPNKEASTIIPIICGQVISGSTIWSDEHKSYARLGLKGYLHDTVCHKYEFVNKSNGINTQAIESFHNELKLEIKRRKGIHTTEREKFLKEFCYYFNNKNDFLSAIFNLIKIN